MPGPIDYSKITIVPDFDTVEWWMGTKERKYLVSQCKDCIEIEDTSGIIIAPRPPSGQTRWEVPVLLGRSRFLPERPSLVQLRL